MSVSTHLSNEPVFCEEINEKAGLIYVISFSDFQISFLA